MIFVKQKEIDVLPTSVTIKTYGTEGGNRMDGKIEERITRSKLLKRDREILDYILKNKKHTCFQTAAEIADALQVSASAVVRASKKLGFENFAKFKRALQEEIAAADATGFYESVPYQKIKAYEDLSDEEILAMFSRSVTANIKTDLSAEMDRKLTEAADMIVKARSVYIVGFRSCFGFASTLGVTLSCMRPGVVVVGNNRPMADALADAGPQDVMIALSFERYAKDAAIATEIARDAGCPVIAMTDSYAAPIAQGAEKVIVSSTENLSYFDSFVSVTMNMEKILLVVSKRDRAAGEARSAKMERYLEQTGQY